MPLVWTALLALVDALLERDEADEAPEELEPDEADEADETREELPELETLEEARELDALLEADAEALLERDEVDEIPEELLARDEADEAPEELPEVEAPEEVPALDTLPEEVTVTGMLEADAEDTTIVDFGEELTELAEAGDAEEDPLEEATGVPEAVEVIWVVIAVVIALGAVRTVVDPEVIRVWPIGQVVTYWVTTSVTQTTG